MKLVVEQARRGISGAVAFSGKLSPFYSSGLAEQQQVLMPEINRCGLQVHF